MIFRENPPVKFRKIQPHNWFLQAKLLFYTKIEYKNEFLYKTFFNDYFSFSYLTLD